MTSTTDLLSVSGADDRGAVLAAARAAKRAEDDDAREVMKQAARWAAMHSMASLVGPVECWQEKALPLGGEGCPEVAEFAVVEFAAALGKSTQAGRHYLGRVVEGRYRLTECWKRLEAGVLPAWKLGFIADRTIALSPGAAGFVDRHVAAVVHKIGAAQLERLIEEAKARFDPDRAEADRFAAARQLLAAKRPVLPISGLPVQASAYGFRLEGAASRGLASSRNTSTFSATTSTTHPLETTT